MSRILRNCLLASPALLGLVLGVTPARSAEIETSQGTIVAQAVTEQNQMLNQLNNYSQEGQKNY